MLPEVPKTEPLSVASLYELLQKQPLDEMSSEAWLEKGINEKMQKQFAQATTSLGNALAKSEQEDNFPRLLESIEHLGDLFLLQGQYTLAASFMEIACSMTLMLTTSGKFFANHQKQPFLVVFVH